MAHEKILVVDDEEDILELVSHNMAAHGFSVSGVTTGEEALKTVKYTPPDLIVLDLMLPGIDGLEVCRTVKQDAKTAHIPIVMLTARGEETDVVTGLELGADDYVTKPFSPRVLVARVKSVLRRGREVDEATVYSRHNISLNLSNHEVLVNGTEVSFTATEFSILQLFLRRPGWVFTRNQIINAVKGDDYPVTDRSIDVQNVGLRKKLGDAGRFIETVRGIGYRMKE